MNNLNYLKWLELANDWMKLYHDQWNLFMRFCRLISEEREALKYQ